MAQINKPTDYFNTVTYTGDGNTTKAITGVGFQPDLVWGKTRSDARNHQLIDSIRGVTQTLQSNVTNAELSSDSSGFLASFDSDGFTTQEGSFDNGNFNVSGRTYVAWNWLGANASSSNTDGTITSQVSASTTSGFSIVSYTGTGANATVGHGLGVAPKMVIFKNRDNGTQEWDTYHTGLTDATYFIQLNSTNAQSNTNGALRFNSTAPSTNYFSVGTATTTNESSSAMIAYCFAEKKGFSKFGTYTGNASTDGPFIYTGFKPAMVIVKASSVAGEAWNIKDNKRNTYNSVTGTLFPNNNAAEDTTAGSNDADFLSNGFRITTTDNNMNYSGATFIYMAFAENPLVGTNNIPCTAR